MNRIPAVLSICLFIVVFATVAVGQEDVMCFCVDDESESTCGGNIDLAAFSQQMIYLCIMNLSQSQVGVWEASIEVEGAENMSGTWQILGEGAINLGESETDFIVGIGLNPLQPNDANVVPLVTLSLLVFNEDPIRFFINPYPGSPTFYDTPGYASAPGMAHPCQTCGGEDLPSFAINWAIEDEARAWGDVKSLYGD
jgi:hypothetical protein